MARKAMEVKSRKQLKIISNQARQKTRQDLKDIISSVDPKVTTEEKMQAAFKLQKRPLKESNHVTQIGVRNVVESMVILDDLVCADAVSESFSIGLICLV